jgi:hypothetical protein
LVGRDGTDREVESSVWDLHRGLKVFLERKRKIIGRRRCRVSISLPPGASDENRRCVL